VYNVGLRIAYQGSFYSGSQKQASTDNTIQGELEKALNKLFVNENIKTLFAGRTDAGVHAAGQYVNFKVRRLIPPSNIKMALNSFLPKDIRVLSVDKIRKSFHARYMAESREYLYNIFVGEQPPLSMRDFVWHLESINDIEKLKQAVALFKGHRDYRSFSLSGSNEKSCVRNIFESEIYFEPQTGVWLGDSQQETKGVLYTYRIRANSFLYRMVRLIVATIVAAGNEQIQVSEISQILDKAERNILKIAPAPAKGLVLKNVIYNKSEEI